jgi:23S rRNA (adenine2503-C2)-methyltransferase
VNLLTLPLPDLETLLTSWGYPAYRGRQIQNHIFTKGVTEFDQMLDLPKQLRALLKERTIIGSLRLAVEQISQDGTKKRAYKLHDGQMIESVLMPYEDGRRTACISSQAGCAMGCVFCATGQMGFARQLTSEEIYEQVARFSTELRGDNERLSNVVMMGMGEPLANYRNVLTAIRRMNTELGIGARRITVSTVGVVPNIRKLMDEDLQVRLAVSLHCATDDERSALLPANRRYGGLDELMSTIREYIRVKKSRVTFEWALIEGKNDSRDVARTLGRLLQRHGIRSDMAHVNLIPLNPTGGYGGGPSGRSNVQNFVTVLEREFGISATPRMRRGVDIDAGCGQLKASVKKKDDMQRALMTPENGSLPIVGVYEDDEGEGINDINSDYYDERSHVGAEEIGLSHASVVNFSIDDEFINLDDDMDAEDFVDPTFEDELDLAEAERLIALVKGLSLQQTAFSTLPELSVESKVKSTTITDEDAIKTAKRRRKKLLKQLDSIQILKDMRANGKVLDREQLDKIAKEEEWTLELESVEHNLM